MKLNNNISQEDIEQLEYYLSGKMTQQEQAAFKIRLETDPALQQARIFITGMKEAMLTEKLDSFHNSATKKVHSIAPKKNLRTWWMAAAAIAIVAVAATVFLFQSNDSDNDKLVAAYFEPDPGLPTTMSSTGNYEFNRGMVDYKAGNYEKAIEAWRPLLAANPGNDTLNYFIGVSFVALKNTDSVTQYLLKPWSNNNSSFRSDAGWYLALHLLRRGLKEEARLVLQQTSHSKKDELLSRIK